MFKNGLNEIKKLTGVLYERQIVKILDKKRERKKERKKGKKKVRKDRRTRIQREGKESKKERNYVK